MTLSKAVSLPILFCLCMAPGKAQALGSIAGTVVDDAGLAVPSAKLLYRRAAAFARDKYGHRVMTLPGAGGSTMTKSDGSFSLSGLVTGDYHLCAESVQSVKVSDCAWDPLQAIHLAPGQVANGVVRHVHDGTLLTIRVSDPNALIELPDAKGQVLHSQRRFVLGVQSSSIYVRADLLNWSPLQKIYQVAIPHGRSIQFFIDTELTVVQSSGASVTARVPVTVPITAAIAGQSSIDLAVK